MLAACLQSEVKEGGRAGRGVSVGSADRQGLAAPEHAELKEKREERDMRQSRNLARRERGEKGGREGGRHPAGSASRASQQDWILAEGCWTALWQVMGKLEDNHVYHLKGMNKSYSESDVSNFKS